MTDTEQTKQVALVYEWENRLQSDFSPVPDPKQTVAQNIFYEIVSNQSTGETYYNVIKRDGYTTEFTQGANVLGIYYWQEVNRLIVVTSTEIVLYNVTTGVATTTTPTASFASANAQFFGVNFTEFLFEDGTVNLVIASDGVIGMLQPSGSWNPITDPDLPSQFNAYPVFLDGYLFISGYDGNIYNSNLNDPYNWTASNFISAESYADRTWAIARAGNYIVALGTTSTEFFYNAANPTGTPLARVDGATQEIGYIQGLVNTDNALYFVGRSSRGAPSVYTIRGLKISEVGTPTVRRWLGTTSISKNSRGHLVNMSGHRFYVVSQNRDNLEPTQTYMLDLDNNMWSSLVLREDDEGPFIFSSTTVFQNNVTDLYAQALTFFSEYNTLTVKAFRPEAYNDDTTTNFTCQFTTRPMDFGNYRVKFMSRLLFYTDQTATSSVMNVSWSDDDLQTFSTPRPVDLSYVYQPLYACGSFRKRAFKITYTDNFHMRWKSIEVDYNQGQA